MSVCILSTLYCALVLPYYQYCNIVWVGDYPTNRHKLNMLRKRAISIISQVKWHDYTSKLIKMRNQLNIFDTNKLQTTCFMYKYITNQLLTGFNYYCLYQMHRHVTTIKYNINITHVDARCSTRRSFTLRIKGPSLWKSTDPSIEISTTFNSFRNTFKRNLLSRISCSCALPYLVSTLDFQCVLHSTPYIQMQINHAILTCSQHNCLIC